MADLTELLVDAARRSARYLEANADDQAAPTPDEVVCATFCGT